ncbi:MAG: LuxR family transcriptional activator of bioluminescence operon [Colwellia sp.]|jgi:LuxR family transcriptional activator of bioluminescence operon
MEVCQLYDLIAELNEAKTQDELEVISLKFCQLVNTPFYLIGIISQNSLYTPSMNILTNYPDKWMSLYLAQNKQRTDPIVSYMMSKNSPIVWQYLLSLDQFKTAEQQLLMEQAKQYGLENGLSIPIHSMSGEVAVFSLAIDIGDESGTNILNEALPYAHTFAMHLFEQYMAILSKESLTETKLTERELECLFWACEGKTSWEISKILEITERTVGFHLNNSTTKLGATNRQHAVAMAMKKGLIRPNI